MAKIKILLADDHEIVRSGLASMLNSYDEFQVVKEIPSGEKAYQAYTELLPDILITDMSMPGIGGLEAVRRICGKFRNARIIVFSMHENVTLAMQAMSAGAKGYVIKSGDSQDLVTAIHQVMNGKNFLSAEMAQKIAMQSVSGSDDPTQRLSTREFEIFRLLAEGLTISQVASQLSLEAKTIANYQTMLKHKLGFNSSAEMVRLAIKYGVVSS
ncbi:MAG: response regulator transcription factor [Pseudomonadota bacterium]|jgi:DNA-binding NarL/FixJ family response regulator|uniref:Two component transcriptional regulator, LuxR family n=2 Tax=Methylophaga TaxID=40222 RepID=F5T3B4_9GAMM|nr:MULTISPECIES: response regulator transcription factor [Methylophaga]MEC9411656.1 response regulator transcription factor [Pseudomonadota bacterium]EGL53606.1 two component transcriptional regulator, LuxR family [Methylophaga aminisulfidivorans MP]WVI84985.1 response regulator transcription factor [Methylophaga thalassica]GLQ00067.1 DNA-binding response regulator [Methylophaga thalassica]HIC46820.1 response regulator transcription factor [Methylophaga sp.]